jgi:hypothetical protein
MFQNTDLEDRQVAAAAVAARKRTAADIVTIITRNLKDLIARSWERPGWPRKLQIVSCAACLPTHRKMPSRRS